MWLKDTGWSDGIYSFHGSTARGVLTMEAVLFEGHTSFTTKPPLIRKLHTMQNASRNLEEKPTDERDR